MGRYCRTKSLMVDTRALNKLNAGLKKLSDKGQSHFLEACAKELAAQLLAKVIKRTPVGVYPASSGKKGGNLRRGWTNGASQNARAYVASLGITTTDRVVAVELVNEKSYASYVEMGHRTRANKNGERGWVDGERMMEISVNELETITPTILENKIQKALKEALR